MLLVLAAIMGPTSLPPLEIAEAGALEVVSYDVVPISNELAVFPSPSSWSNDPRLVVLVKVLNASFSPDLGVSVLSVDGMRLVLDWEGTNRTVWGAPEGPLVEGRHEVDLHLRDATTNALSAEWSFGIDVTPPLVSLDPLPVAADVRVFTVNGSVVEDHLKGIDVNGFGAVVNEGRFLVPVLLWPGRNDVEATAIDEAGNRGLGVAWINWFPPTNPDETYLPFLHKLASFTTRFPADWQIEVDRELEGGLRADVLASEPATVPLRATIAVLSRPTGATMDQDVLLSILEEALLRLSSGSQVTVVSRPARIEPLPSAVAAQLAYVETLAEGLVVFRSVTAVWSSGVGRLWVIIGSMAAEEVDEKWAAVQNAVEGFRTIEPPPSITGDDRVTNRIAYAFAATIAAIAVILSAFGVALYSLRRRRRPPRTFS
ncbi:MAG TPA: hypothetical protein VJ326_08655 [Thermoplasmata archaeon]|nr:hypothetical protein [Thermoplasmata archaeon]